MSIQRTTPTEAYAPDADREDPDAPVPLPEWLAFLIARLIFVMLRPLLAARRRRYAQLPTWWQDRPDLPPVSAQALAASIRGSFGTAIAWMCLRHGIGPGHKNWPELSRYIVMFGGSLARFRPGLPAFGLQWWESPNIVPCLIAVPAPTPAADATALLLSRTAAADSASLAANDVRADPMAAEAMHSLSRASGLPASWWQVFARAGTGPPTGPPIWPPTGPPAAWAASCPGLPTLLRLTNGAGARPAPPY